MTPVRNNTEALLAVQRATTHVTLAHLIAPGALQALRDGIGGYKSTASGSDTSAGGNRTITVDDEHGVPDVIPVTGVEAAVLNGRTDKASVDLAAVYEGCERLYDAAVAVAEILARWNPPRQLTVKDVRDAHKDLYCANPGHKEHDLPWRSNARNHQGKYLTEADLKLWRIRQKGGKKSKGRREAA